MIYQRWAKRNLGRLGEIWGNLPPLKWRDEADDTKTATLTGISLKHIFSSVFFHVVSSLLVAFFSLFCLFGKTGPIFFFGGGQSYGLDICNIAIDSPVESSQVPDFPFSPAPMGSPPAISIAESLGWGNPGELEGMKPSKSCGCLLWCLHSLDFYMKRTLDGIFLDHLELRRLWFWFLVSSSVYHLMMFLGFVILWSISIDILEVVLL